MTECVCGDYSDDSNMVQRQRKFNVFLFLATALFFTLSIPLVLANHINFMDVVWTTGDDAENLSLNQGETAELYLHVPFVPSGNSFTFAVRAENDAGSQYLVSTSTRTAPDSRTIPISTSSLAGEYEIIVQAVNAGGTDVETLQLDVNTRPEIILPASPITVIDGQNVQFSLVGTDADDDVLRLIATSASLPSGATLRQISSSTGRIEKEFSWTPSYSQVGTHTIKFRVTDEDGFAAIGEMQIIVIPHNFVPEITDFGNGSGETLSDDNSIKEGETLTAQVYASDADGDALSYEVERRNYCIVLLGRITCYYTSTLPEEMNFNAATGRFTFAPGFDFVEHPALERVVRLRFRAFDGEFYSAWKEMTTTVQDVNQRPIADTIAFTILEDHPVTLALPAHDNDVEDELTYALGGIMPAHGDLSNFDPATGVVTYTPQANYSGLDSFTFFVEDDTGSPDARSGQGTITFEIGGVNDLPALSIPDVTRSEDFATATFNLRNYVSDVESTVTAFTFTVVGQTHPEVVNCAMETATPSFRLQCTSVANQFGSSEITVTATDGNGGTARDTFVFTVTPVNDLTVTLLGQVPLSTPEETPLALTLAHLVVEDPDGEFPAGFSLSVASGANYTFSGTTITPARDFNGTLSVPVTLLQGSVVQGTITLMVMVTPVNDAPVARNDAVEVTEDTPRVISVLANDSDVDGTLDPSSVRITHAPRDGTAGVNVDGTITYTPELNSLTSESFTYTVEDNNGTLSNEARVVITFRSVNDAPQFSMPSQSVEEDSGIHTYNLRDYASDVEDTPEELSFVISEESQEEVIDCEIAPDGFTLVCTVQPNQNGESMVQIQVTDSEDSLAVFPVKFTVTAVNDAPSSESFIVVLDEDTPANIQLRGTDSEGTALEYFIFSSPEKGTFSGFNSATGNLLYTPQANYFGTDSFRYYVKDESGEGEVSAKATVTLIINSVNDAPLFAIPDFFVEEDSGTFSVNLRHFASDIENTNEQLLFIFGSETHAEIIDCEIAADGFTLNCTTETNQTGESIVNVRVIDSLGAVAPATFKITVLPASDAPEITGQVYLSTPEETPLELSSADLVITDGDAGEGTFTLTINPGENYMVDGTGTTIIPARDFNGMLFVEVTVKDASGEESLPFILQVEVTPVNDAPVAESQNVLVDEDSFISITLSGTDVDGTVVGYEILENPMHGSLSGVAPDLVYVPLPDFTGEDSFTFAVEDNENARSEEATITIVVAPINDAPVAQDDAAETAEEVVLTIDVLGNDSDVDGDVLHITEISEPSFGTAGIVDDKIIYTPRENIFGVVDEFTYTIADPSGEEAEATVRVTITALDDDTPQITGQRDLSMEEDSSLTLLLSDLTVIDPDEEYPAGFELVILEGEHYTFTATTLTPELNFNGRLEVLVQVVSVSGDEHSNTFVLKIEVTPVNDAPIAQDDTFATEEDEEIDFNVMENDADVDNENLVMAIISSVTHGTLVCDADGDCTYVPEENFTGMDSFTYQVTDGSLNDEATVTINVGAQNDAPIITGQEILSTLEDTSLIFTLSNLFVTDADNSYPEGFTLEIEEGENYTLDSMTLTPSANFNGTLEVPVRVFDGNAWSEWFILQITVTPVNDIPVADAQSIPVEEDISETFRLTGSDIENSPLTFTLATTPAHGTLTGFNSASGEVTYTPQANFTGEDLFTFTVSDGLDTSLPAIVSLTIGSESDAPILAPIGNKEVTENMHLEFLVSATDVDSTDADLIFSVERIEALTGATFINRFFSWTPTIHQAGRYELTFIVTDETGLSDEEEVIIIVHNSPQIPVAHAQTVSLAEDTSQEITLTGEDSDGSIVAYTITTAPVHGRLSGTAPHLIYTPVRDFHGTDSFTFTVRDNDGLNSAPAVVALTITDVNDAPIITSQPITTAFIDEPYTYQVTVSDDGESISYLLQEAPEGMSLSSTGLINWTPRRTGTYPVVILVRDDAGLTAEQHFTIIVAKAREDLQIMSIQLSSEDVQPGDAVTVAVFAKNKGEKSQKDLEVQLAVPELGIQQNVSLGTLKAGQGKSVKQALLLPYDADSEEAYLLVVTIRNDQVHETEYRYIYMMPSYRR